MVVLGGGGSTWALVRVIMLRDALAMFVCGCCAPPQPPPNRKLHIYDSRVRNTTLRLLVKPSNCLCEATNYPEQHP